jgi:hypothetical protein
MELYPWRFDSLHFHCHDDVNSILHNFKEFWAIAHLRNMFKINRNEWEPADRSYRNVLGKFT